MHVTRDVPQGMFLEKVIFPGMFYKTTFPSFPKMKLLCDISNCIILEEQIKYLEE